MDVTNKDITIERPPVTNKKLKKVLIFARTDTVTADTLSSRKQELKLMGMSHFNHQTVIL